MRHYGYDARPDGDFGENVLYQQRTNTLTDREVLAIAADEIPVDDLTDGQKDALYYAEGWAKSKIGEAPWH